MEDFIAFDLSSCSSCSVVTDIVLSFTLGHYKIYFGQFVQSYSENIDDFSSVPFDLKDIQSNLLSFGYF